MAGDKLMRATGRSSPWAVTSRPRCGPGARVRTESELGCRLWRSSFPFSTPPAAASSLSPPSPSPSSSHPSAPPSPQALTLDSDVDYMLNGHDDDPMTSGALSPAPLSNSDDSDNTMQVDSDVDVTRNPDADADGEYDDEKPDGIPQPSGTSSSFHSKRVVRSYAPWWCG